MSPEERYVTEFFSVRGVHVEKIPESHEKSPDFYLEYDGMKILIELKTKFDDEDLIKRREEALCADEIFEYSTIWERKNSISSAITKAYKQLSGRKSKVGADFCYIFFLSAGNYSSAQLKQFEATLYGSKEILSLDRKDMHPKTCYYYTFSDFYRYKDVVDGAFILSESSGRLCLNDQSERYSSAKQSAFVQIFQPGVLDPRQLEAEGKAFLITEDIDRKNVELVNDYLKEKYHLEKVIPFSWPHFTVTSRIRHE